MNLLESLASELDRCNKCGFCLGACPTYLVSLTEWNSTRGRISLVQDVLSGDLGLLDPGFQEAVNTCLLCRSCTATCPPQIDIYRVMTRVRAATREVQPAGWAVRLFYRHVLPRPRLLRTLARLAYLSDRLGLRRLALRLGLLRPWPDLERAATVGPEFPGVTGRELIEADQRPPKPSPGLAGAAPGPKVAYFLCCARDLLYPEAARATVRVLRANGVEVLVPKVNCCGLPAHSAGDLEAARRMARSNLAVLAELDVDAVISDDSSCGAHLANLPSLFTGLPEEQSARRLAAKVQDLTVFLDRLQLHRPGALPLKAAWHDPCHLRHHLGVSAEPRRVLRQVPGLELVTLPEAGCCGGAGSYLITQPALSDSLRHRRLAAVAEAGVEAVVTGSTSCATQLRRGDSPVKVLFLSELLESAYAEKPPSDKESE